MHPGMAPNGNRFKLSPQNQPYGIFSLCIGGGQGIVAIFEWLN